MAFSKDTHMCLYLHVGCSIIRCFWAGYDFSTCMQPGHVAAQLIFSPIFSRHQSTLFYFFSLTFPWAGCDFSACMQPGHVAAQHPWDKSDRRTSNDGTHQHDLILPSLEAFPMDNIQCRIDQHDLFVLPNAHSMIVRHFTFCLWIQLLSGNEFKMHNYH